MDPLQIDIYAEGQERPTAFWLTQPATYGRAAALILFNELAAYVRQHPAPAYSLSWSTGAGVGGFDFAGDFSAALAQCADELSGPGALTSPPAFDDPAEESAARFWVGLLSRAVRNTRAGRVL